MKQSRIPYYRVIAIKNDCHVIEVVPRKDFIGWRYPCLYCKKWHFHGLGLGPRVSHCINEDSPYYGKTIILGVFDAYGELQTSGDPEVTQ